MRKSKFLLAAVTAVGTLALVIFVAVFWMMDRPASHDDGFYVHNFDSQIADMKIVNGEKEYFAVQAQSGKNETYYTICDRQLKPLLETELSLTGEKVGRYLPMGNHKDQWWLLDVETLELRETDLIEPVVHKSGEYMAGQRKVKGQTSWVVERTKTGEILWEGSRSIVLPAQQWYAIFKASDEEGSNAHDQIINLRTGEVEYTAKEGESIIDGGLGYWKIYYDLYWDYVGREEHFYCEYLLDGNYEAAFDGQLFGNLSLDGDFIYGYIREKEFLSDIEKLKFAHIERIGFTIRHFIWTPQGDEIYRTGSMYYDLLGIRGNYAVAENDRDQYELWIIEDGGISRKIKAGKNFFYLDAEDGFMRTVKKTGSNHFGLDLKNVPEDENQSTSYKASDYRWSFMDMNLETVLPFEYTYVSESENGFAVVKNAAEEYAIIDLKKCS